MKSSNFYFSALTKCLVDEGISVRFSAGGSSMLPFVKPGTPLVVKKVSLQHLAPGDIILYQSADGSVISHRLVKVRGHEKQREFITAADNETRGVTCIRPENIIAKVIEPEAVSGVVGRGLARFWFYARPLRRIKRLAQTQLSSVLK